MELSEHQKNFLEKLKQLCMTYKVESMSSVQNEILITFRDETKEGSLRNIEYDNFYNLGIPRLNFQVVGRM